MAFHFNGIPDWLKPRSARSEELEVEASLVLVFDPSDLTNFHYFLETRVINSGGLPVSIQAIVCETNGEGPFTGTGKSYPADGEGEPGFRLEKKGDVLHENFELEISSASQFASTKPVVAVKTRSGKRFAAEVDRKNIERILAFEAEKAAPPLTAPRKGPIVVVDDEGTDCQLILKALAANAVENPVVIVPNGQELLDYLHGQGLYSKAAAAPCFILLDLNMPGMGGHEALKRIKEDPLLRKIPIIVLSGSQIEEDVDQSYAEGAASFLTKPSNFEGMVQAMGALNVYWQETAELPLGKNSQN